MKTYLITFTETNFGYVRIKAETVEEAERIFEDTDITNLSPRYTDGSVSIEEIKLQNKVIEELDARIEDFKEEEAERDRKARLRSEKRKKS